MAMERWIEGQEQKGNETAVAFGRTLLEQFGEIQLPPAAQDIVKAPLSKETQQFVEKLKKDGFSVYDLLGKSPAALRGEGMKFWYVNPVLESISSNPSLIAFKPNPDEFFLKGSFNMPHEKQLEILDNYDQAIQNKYPGAGLVVREAEASEWAETALSHFKTTNKRLFGREYDLRWTWTNTYENEQPGANRADVGRWGDVDGLDMGLDHPDDVYPNLGLAPVVEIPRA